MINAPAHIRTIKPYVPGKPIEELERELGIKKSVKLASNENPLGPSPKAMKALSAGLKKSLNRYPDGNGYNLKRALAEILSEIPAASAFAKGERGGRAYKVSQKELILGNGSNELLDIAVRTFLNPGDEAVMAHPSFVVYSMSVQAMAGKPVQVPLKDYRHDLEAMLDAVTPGTKMLFIANPNNPTGTINTKTELDRLMNKIKDDVLVVIDEAYCEYVANPEYPDSLKYFRDGRNILILRTFSKLYGLAGLRIGYGIAREDIIAEMNKIRAPFNTNTIAQRVAIEALTDKAHITRTININARGKKYLYKELSRLGIKYVPTEANFIYMLTNMDSGRVYEDLLKEGVIVRPMGPHELRVTIGLPEENKRFIKALKIALGT